MGKEIEGQISFGKQLSFEDPIKFNRKEKSVARIYKIETIGVELMSPKELFKGFDTFYGITFSYNLHFIETILKDYKSARLIFGCPGKFQDDNNTQAFIAEVLATSGDAGRHVAKYPSLAKMMRDGTLELRTPRFNVTDHRKLYILSSKDNRTRVIAGSANLSERAFLPDAQMEVYEYDDTAFRYNESMEDFQVMWDFSEDVPYKALSGDIVKDNPIIQNIKETDSTILLQETHMESEEVQYIVEHNSNVEIFKALLENSKPDRLDGKTLISAKEIRKLENKWQHQNTKSSSEIYVPSMTFDIPARMAFLDGIARDLEPADDAVKADLKLWLEALDVYSSGDFINPRSDMSAVHFRMQNLLFISPFHAPLRYALHCAGRDSASSLPLFMTAASTRANAGKTYMLTLGLRLMTGKKIRPRLKSETNKDAVREILASTKGTPIFIDEIDPKYLSTIKDVIKNDTLGSDLLFSQVPMIVMAGNMGSDPDNTIRRRMGFFRMSGALSSEIDGSAYAAKGRSRMKGAGDAFYRAYTAMVLDELASVLECLRDYPNDWYLDTVNISSRIIISLMEKYGIDAPPYIKELHWDTDYVREASNSAIAGISMEYEHNKRAFSRSGNHLVIKLGNDDVSKDKVNSWYATLPAELFAEKRLTRDDSSLIIGDVEELERLTKIKIKRRLIK